MSPTGARVQQVGRHHRQTSVKVELLRTTADRSKIFSGKARFDMVAAYIHHIGTVEMNVALSVYLSLF